MIEAQALLDGLRSYLLPGGPEAARGVARMRLTEKGELRSGPEARWLPFTAVETIEAARSGFVWEARMRTSRFLSTVVVDAYEESRGRLTVKAAGAIPLLSLRGPDVDRGELQRYLASLMSCPAALVANRTLAWDVAGPRTLRVRDTDGPAGATVDLELNGEGCPVVARALRPRTVGKKIVLTEWTAAGREFREHEGLRIPFAIEAAWRLPDGEFTYFRGEVTEVFVERGA